MMRAILCVALLLAAVLVAVENVPATFFVMLLAAVAAALVQAVEMVVMKR